jgi:hypothetical protein
VKDLYDGTINAQFVSLGEWEDGKRMEIDCITEELDDIVRSAIRARGKEKTVKIFRCGIDDTFTITKDKK